MKSRRISVLLTAFFFCTTLTQAQDSLHVTKLGSLSYWDEVEAITVVDTLAYVAVNSSGLRIIDISDPTNSLEVGFYETQGYANGVAVSGNYAYVTNESNELRSSGLRVIDITNPASPTEVGFCDLPGYPNGVVVSGSFAYVAAGSAGLWVIFIAVPSSPIVMGFCDTEGYAYGVAMSGDFAYVADQSGYLRIISIVSLLEVGHYRMLHAANSVAVSGNYAYVANEDDGLRVINVSNPTSPSYAGYCNTPGRAFGVAVSGNYAYVADGESGLRVIDITNLTSLTEVGYYDTPGLAWGVVVSGSIAYVADVDNFSIYDCSEAVSAAEHTQKHIPNMFTLESCYPNPFNPTTTISYDVAAPSRVQLTVYSVLGQEVAKLVDGMQMTGTHSIIWNAESLPSGTYLCRMTAGDFMQTRKLVLMK